MSKRDAVEEAEDLLELLDEILSQGSFTAARRADLESYRANCADLATLLRTFNDEVSPLSTDSGHDLLTAALAQWKALDGGVYRSGDHQLDRMVETSAALQPLYRAGIDITAVQKFSPDEQRLAKTLGEGFESWHRPWDTLKLALGGTTPGTPVRCRASELDVFDPFMRAMERHDVISSLSLEAAKFKGAAMEWAKATPKRAKKLPPKHPCRYTFEPRDASKVSLMTGLWFNAFAFDVVDDHLTRNHIEHELYTNVMYKAPTDIISVSGDFDVLGRFDDLVLLIECKSGRLVEKDRGHFTEIREKAATVTRVYEGMGGEFRLVPMLLFNPHLTSRDRVEEELEGSSIWPVQPDELRSVIARLATKGVRRPSQRSRAGHTEPLEQPQS